MPKFPSPFIINLCSYYQSNAYSPSKKQKTLLLSIPIELWLAKEWTADLTNKMKHSFFQAAVMPILLYGCTTWMLAKRMEKKLDGNYTRMLRAILNKSWRQHPTKQQLYGHLIPIMKTIEVRWTRHAEHCWRSKDELISDVLLWTPSHGRTKAGRPAWTYIQHLCEDTECSPEDLPEVMNDREGWRERVRDISADGMTRWWWLNTNNFRIDLFENYLYLIGILKMISLCSDKILYIYIYIYSYDIKYSNWTWIISKQITLSHRQDSNRDYHSGSEWSNSNEEMTPHSPDLQNWTVTTRRSGVWQVKNSIQCKQKPHKIVMQL